MKIAYLILVHHKPAQFKWLFDALHNLEDVFAIHVDRNAPPEVHGAIRELTAHFPNVLLLPSRPILWGGWSLAKIQLDAIDALLAADSAWGYFINLSGQDFPLKSPAAIRAELMATPDRNYIESAAISSFPFGDRGHLERRRRFRRYEIAGRIVGTPIPAMWGKKVRVRFKGSAWCTLSRAFCEWINNSPLARACIDAVRYTYIPDEFLMQTLCAEGPFAATRFPGNRREILWTGKSHPETLTMGHLEHLKRSSADFARKFDVDVDRRIVEELALHLRRSD